MKTIIITLMFLSGFCGISYEVVYARIITNYFGAHLSVYSAILLSFLLGIALGNRVAQIARKYLWLIEILIGLYAIFLTIFLPWLDTVWIQTTGSNANSLGGVTALTVALLLTPAILIGISVPAFSELWGSINKRRGSFAGVYFLYNLGGACTALAIEFCMLRVLGLQGTTCVLASLNILVGAAIGIVAGRRYWLLVESVQDPEDGEASTPCTSGGLVPTSIKRENACLCVMSVASGVIQILNLSIAESVLGPFNETFALVLSITLVGLALGAFLVRITHLSLSRLALYAACAVSLQMLLLTPGVLVYATAYPLVAPSAWKVDVLKVALLGVLFMPGAITLGATVPSLLAVRGASAGVAGRTLSWSAYGNSLGYILMISVLHRHFEYGTILSVSVLTLLLVALMLKARAIHAISCLLFLAIGAMVWNEELLFVGYQNFRDVKRLRESTSSVQLLESYKGARDTMAIVKRDHSIFYVINGYVSNPINSPAEVLVGAISSAVAPRLDNGLVLGLGSGATAGTAGLFFEQLDVVEINEAAISEIHRLSEFNFSVKQNSHVNIHHDDGIHFLKQSPKRYSLIINTVTSPLFFSSSKLYTDEFFSLVKSHLTEDGRYTTWIDNRIGDLGLDIILETLRPHFRECGVALIRSGYFLLMCGDSQFIDLPTVERVVDQKDLSRYLMSSFSFPSDVIPYQLLVPDLFAKRKGVETPHNTLDYPVLEFVMTTLEESDLSAFKRSLCTWIDAVQLAKSFRAVMWDAGMFQLALRFRMSPSTPLLKDLNKALAEKIPGISEATRRAADVLSSKWMDPSLSKKLEGYLSEVQAQDQSKRSG